MVSLSVTLVLLSVAIVSVSSTFYESAEETAAERRKFGLKKLKKLRAKKSWFASLFSHSANDDDDHGDDYAGPEFVSLDEVPTWRYKKVTYRPIRVIAVPAAHRPGGGQYAKPYPKPPEVHAEYGPPVEEDYVNSVPEYSVPDESGYRAPQQTAAYHGPGDYLASKLALISQLKNLKLLGKANAFHHAAGLLPASFWPLPMPAMTYPVYGSYPYNFNVHHLGSLPLEPQAPPPPHHATPPLYDSYGNHLPDDAYTSATSNRVPSYARPDADAQQPVEPNSQSVTDRRQSQETPETVPDGGQIDKTSVRDEESGESAASSSTSDATQ